jgi:hypothetical protein
MVRDAAHRRQAYACGACDGAAPYHEADRVGAGSSLTSTSVSSPDGAMRYPGWQLQLA